MLDGTGYTLSGPYNGTLSDIWVIGQGANQLPQSTLEQYVIGVDLANSSVYGVTIENINIRNFSIGMYMWTQNNTIKGNDVSDNIVGILLSGSNTTITKNYISNNQRGLFFGFNIPGQTPSDITVNQNDFEDNVVQLIGCQCKAYNISEPPHNWDNGHLGNHWGDYNGTDTNHDGIGDTPYTIDVVDRDRFPLMQSPAQPPIPQSQVSMPKIPLEAIILFVSVPTLLAATAIAFKHKRKTQSS